MLVAGHDSVEVGHSHDRLDLVVEVFDEAGNTAVHAEDLIIHHGSQRKPVEGLVDLFVDNLTDLDAKAFLSMS